ncbi:MAG: F0F1 ATP synthase subunit B [Microbacteriaceae bacterium]|jgi:F-type H+-transporting ATPase subunit b|nr:F0F1 ATP synthase subunit B [Microbacteriaceae bacterium]MBT5248259.1 F0F1 ATP synthase subunit B [Microbacteriaceae bacterium]MBT5616412.1 F0F1 ATP synthase subunit B [Microbacteriaceae bacterium]MBT5730027.1 F0F1 ATP synthase subunit B [Microbacteriaceae bacterium]MBT7803517.1 F0F1 ATP synthase subunit B [Microbacteriaceae bacterium]
MHMEALFLAAEGESPNPLIPAIYDIVWSIIPFALVLFLFWRIVLPRLQKTLDERSLAIEGGIAEAQSAQDEAKKALDKYNKLLKEARQEASEIRDQARAEGSQILAEMKTSAQSEADRIAANAQAQIESQRAQAVLSLRKEVGALALDLAAAVVQERLSEDAKAASVVDRLLADLDKDAAPAKKAAAKKAKA